MTAKAGYTKRRFTPGSHLDATEPEAFTNMQTPPLETGPMTDEVLRGIFASDQDMYPAPLTWERLRSWTTAAPDMATCFYLPAAEGDEGRADRRSLVGAVIVLPLLARAWRDLLAGHVKETDVDAESMFACEGVDGDEDDGGPHPEVGLHVFHVERFDIPATHARVRGFANLSIRAVGAVAEGKGWKIIGHSALTATPEGRRCFERMGFEPTGYEELWMTDGRGGVELVAVSADMAREQRTAPDAAAVRGHARMVARYLPPAHGA
ncbi:uncharacterized protein LY79DRAFT_588572 [Colletotrichum navitas]|uniref:Uncharacterized protein n=1 Tax=Colletotrichum navitas TaxID=681940 RepID=A0AAD8V622_9PEZI|nr:uncharacterized protein LY79DRAFT_588572 [Colletotrichum navitas]KAK1595592.1 hypothetical protein LY79DRAFT_588572 [Colletotrichum navitas]